MWSLLSRDCRLETMNNVGVDFLQICMLFSVVLVPRYIDDSEIVLSLKKTDDDVKWPSLEEAWASLTEGVSQLLKGTSVYVVGGSTDINWAVAKELAAGLE